MSEATKKIDQLTGLCSRETFYTETRCNFDKCPENSYALMLLDINRLTMINELFGLEEGDKLLKFLGNTLQRVFLGVTSSCVARLQADLFAVSFPYEEEDIEKYICEIEQAVRRYSLSLNIDILMSFGIYKVDDLSMEVQLMRDRAALALKTVKGNYIHHYAYYDTKMHEKILSEQRITQTMNKALKDREFVIYYQPKHSLDDESIIGAEALVRWISPERGMISPGEFIPIFEENGFIMKLDAYVWESACNFIRQQLAYGVNLKPVSVNISRIDLYNPELCQILQGLVEQYKIPYTMLELEFTESAFMENPHLLIQTMLKLQQMGFRVDIDDFGSGYSSLNMLKDAPVDVLKIDLNFLSRGSNEDRANRIMSSVVRMAKTLGISSIVEGVETKEQIDFLKSIGCTMVQGYYFSKPMPEDQYIAYINAHDATSVKEDVELDAGYHAVDPEAFWKETIEGPMGMSNFFDACYTVAIRNGVVDVLRVSDNYFSLMESTREELYARDGQTSEPEISIEDQKAYMDMLEGISDGVTNGELTYVRKLMNGKSKTLYARARMLTKKEDTRYYFVMLNDITNKTL